MLMNESLGVTVPLPEPPSGWFDHSYAVLMDGSLALLRTKRDINSEEVRRVAELQTGNRHAERPKVWPVRARLSTFDGSTEGRSIEVLLDYWSHVDRLADGRWLVAATSAEHGENKARLYGSDGAPAGEFEIGNGVNHIRCAPDGTIWVGYSDEGLFATRKHDGTWPIETSGIARLAPNGNILWNFDTDRISDHSIVDCYALTLVGNTPWCCTYTDFPIIRVDCGVPRHWQNGVDGAVALAIDGDHVLLAGGYYDEANRIALLCLEGKRARSIGELRLEMPTRHHEGLVQGQGRMLHIVGQKRWTRLDVATVLAALKA